MCQPFAAVDSCTLGMTFFCGAFSLKTLLTLYFRSHQGARFLNQKCGITYDHTAS